MPSQSRRLLIVDDEAIIVTFMRSLLTSGDKPFAIETAVDGDQAIVLASEFRPHVIVLDINIPGKDGFEVCKAITAETRCRHSIVVGMTGDPEPARLKKMKAAGAVDVVIKPFELAEFVSLVQRYADKAVEREMLDNDPFRAASAAN